MKGWTGKAAAVVALAAVAGAALVWLAPSAKPKGGVFVGYYRYRFQLTPQSAAAYQVTSAFRDEAKTHEVVFVHPKTLTSEQALATPESNYARLGIVRLEVNPNSQYPPQAQDKLIDAFRYAATQTLDEKKTPYKLAQLEGAPLPGFAIEIGGEHPLTQVFMKGARVHYLFTGAGDDRRLHEMLSSLEDAREIP